MFHYRAIPPGVTTERRSNMAWSQDAPAIVSFTDDATGANLTCTNIGGVGTDGPFSCALKDGEGANLGSFTVPDLAFLDALFGEVAAALETGIVEQ